jgi:hypothetical protein
LDATNDEGITMDLNNLDVVKLANEGTVLELLHPATGELLTDEKGKEPKAFFLRLLGTDSDIFRSTLKRRVERNQNKKSKKADLDEAELKAAELLAKCTTDCYMIENGKPVDCTKENMVRLYLKLPWLREQAEEHMTDRSVLMMK